MRFVNVVDLMTLQPEREHPHGLSDDAFDAIFTANKPIVFNFHGYPWLIHRLTYRRTNHDGMHVRGYKEEGTTTTPFDMAVMNDIDRFHLVLDVIARVPGLHMGLALSSTLASYLNLWLLWRALRRGGMYTRQPGWGVHLLRLTAACAALTAVLIAGLLVWPDWTVWPAATRALRLIELIAAAGAAYVVALFACG